jgi:signal transduction histidine kinase
MKILIAEDNRFYRQLLEATVSGWGYEVVGVGDGLAAWEILRERNAPHLAILDWLMPGLSGLELCRKVRSLNRPRPTYLIMLTAKGEKEDILTALHNGADDYIAKPFDQEELHARLQAGTRIVALQTSLSERIGALENALSEAQKIEAIGRLAGGIAHDFNNLLTVVIGYSELLLGKMQSGSDPRDFLTVIKDAAERGASLTRQLLAFARKQILHPVVLDLNNSVDTVSKMLSRLIGENIHVVTRVNPQIHPVEADPGQIEQVLMNLLLNARDAMPEGGTVAIATDNVDISEEESLTIPEVVPGSFAVVTVTDTGRGMDEQTRSRIFEPFFTTKEVGKGTGLGLATAYGIVRQSGGFIQVESEVGHGSTFRVYLPRAVRGPVREPRASSPALDGGQETVLLVEDEDRVRVLLNSVLTLHGYTVLEASTGEDALRLARQHPGPIHLMLTDIVMPGMNGYETAQCLSALRPEMTILYMSGYTDETTLYPGTDRSPVPFLQKPFSPEALTARVREELARKECPTHA